MATNDTTTRTLRVVKALTERVTDLERHVGARPNRATASMHGLSPFERTCRTRRCRPSRPNYPTAAADQCAPALIIEGYGAVFNQLAVDERAEFCTSNTFREFLAKPHRGVPLTLNHDGPILAGAIALHIDSCGLAFSAEISESAWTILGPRMLGAGFTQASIGFLGIEKEQRIYRGEYVYEVLAAEIDHVAVTDRAAWPTTGVWPSGYELEDQRLAQLCYRYQCGQRSRLRGAA